MWKYLMIIAGLIVPLQVFAQVTARLERETIALDETVRLVIETSDSANRAQPELDGLRESFNLLDTSSSQNVSIINGRQTTLKRWVIELEPKFEGSFTIAPMKLGDAFTPAIQLTVLPATAISPGGSRDIFIEAQTDRDQAYVQQQILLTIRLFIGVNLIDGSLTDPTPEDTVVTRLGEDIQYDARHGDQDYRVVERRYALFPQNSGVLKIPAVRFQGLVEEANQSGDQLFNRLFNQGKRIRSKSSGITMEILPPPAAFTGNHWLPATRLQINDLSPDHGEVKAGQPITRTVQVQAQGLTAEQLPELSYPSTEGFKIYPDKPLLETQRDDDNVVGLIQQSAALVPTAPGEMILPELRLDWWNTSRNRAETAVLPSKKVIVLPTSASDQANPGSASSDASLTDTELTANTSLNHSAQNGPRPDLWKWISLGLMTAWLVTLLLLWRTRGGTDRQSEKSDESGENPAKTRHLLEAIKSSSLKDDAAATRKAILAWAGALWRENPPDTLSDLIERVDNPALGQALRELDAHLYARPPTTWRGATLWTMIANQIQPQAVASRPDTDELPPLYPQPR